jgi:hypothetical protein
VIYSIQNYKIHEEEVEVYQKKDAIFSANNRNISEAHSSFFFFLSYFCVFFRNLIFIRIQSTIGEDHLKLIRVKNF